MAKVTTVGLKNGSVSYEVRWRDEARRSRKKRFSKRSEAEELAQSLDGLMRRRPYASIRERIKQSTTVDQSGCWVWTLYLDQYGYGRCDRGAAYRVAYEAFVAPIPKDLEIDHLCRNRACVNPSHLEPVTHAENMRRRSVAQSHCKNGHERTPKNTYVHIRRDGRIDRKCRDCNAATAARLKARKKEQTA